MKDRKLESWVDGFTKYTENMGSPPLFSKWAGIFTIAGALERKTWVRTAKGVLYPNLYIVLIGPPGVGKTLATSVGYDMLSELKDHHISPTSVTKASLVDALRNAERRVIPPSFAEPPVSFNSLTVMSDELGVLIPAYENDFMNTLTNIYDCRVYSETRRTSKVDFKLPSPQISLVAATTPSYLSNLIPEGAWDQGFMSRVIMVYAGEIDPSDLFTGFTLDEKLFNDLVADLKTIGAMYGAMVFEPDAAKTISNWHMKKGPPAPDHPRLYNYSTRRTAHLLKLCQIAAASAGTLTIKMEHLQTAFDWLLEVESFMPDIFKSMRSGGSVKVMEEAYHYLYHEYIRAKKKPVPDFKLVRFLNEKIPAHQISVVIEAMEKSRIIKRQIGDDAGTAWEPMEKPQL